MSIPGWYPDPGGQPGRYRYWDGAAWTSALSADPGAAPPRPVDTSRAAGPSSGGRRRSITPWLVLAGVGVVIAIVVALIVLPSVIPGGGGRGLGGETPAPPTTCPEATVGADSPPPVTGDQVTSGRLSYPTIPAPFTAPSWDRRVPFGREVRSQDATVESDSAGTPTWVAGALIARLTAGDGFYDPQQGAALVAECVVSKFYGNAAVTRDDMINRATTVDGHEAWIIEAHLSFELMEVQTRGEVMIIVVVDVGDSEAGLFYGSIPDTSPQFEAPIRAALSQLQVA